VEPHLPHPLVKASVELGMKLYDKTWIWEDGPHSIGMGAWNGQRVTKDKLSWYQPWGRCHWISFFSCAIGLINYPKYDWHIVLGDCHTVAAGSWNGECKVVMDILQFKWHTAEGSLEWVSFQSPNPQYKEGEDGWEKNVQSFVEIFGPPLREYGHRYRERRVCRPAA
jgi:hypothetical protein